MVERLVPRGVGARVDDDVDELAGWEAARVYLSQQEPADDVLLAAAQFVQAHFRGNMDMTFRATDGGQDLHLSIRVTEDGAR